MPVPHSAGLFRLSAATLLAATLLTACESRQTPNAPTAPPSGPTAAPDSAVVVATPAVAPDTTDISETLHHLQEGRDTTFRIGGQPYRLLLRADVDSTKPLRTEPGQVVGPAFAADSSASGQVQGYEGGQTITLLDPRGRPVFRRRLRKQDFFGVAGRDVVTVSDPQRPVFLGYHAPSQRLVFSVPIGIPYSDVGQEYTVVLGLDGRVRYLGATFSAGFGPDCAPRLLPDGTILTCEELLRPDGRRISLLKPKSELLAAFPLSDTTLCTMYMYGEYHDRPQSNEEASAGTVAPVDAPVTAGFYYPEWVPDKRMRNAPSAFVLNTRGQVRQRFMATECFEAIINYVPRHYVWQAHSYYLPNGKAGLVVLDKRNPRGLTRLGFRQMQRFRPPRRPAEVRFELSVNADNFAFYVDPARPTQLRYERIEPRQ